MFMIKMRMFDVTVTFLFISAQVHAEHVFVYIDKSDECRF